MASANTSALFFSWHRSVGQVDLYDLSLYRVDEATANHRAELTGSRKQQQQHGVRRAPGDEGDGDQ